MNYLERITIESDKRGGKPCLRGLRITVYDILDYLAGGMTTDEILGDFPDLEREDIQAALAFAAIWSLQKWVARTPVASPVSGEHVG